MHVWEVRWFCDEGCVVGELGDFVAYAVGFDAEDVRVVLDEAGEGFVERGEDNALGGQIGGHGAARDQLAVGENDLGGMGEVREVGDVLGRILGQLKAGQVEVGQAGETPGLVGA